MSITTKRHKYLKTWAIYFNMVEINELILQFYQKKADANTPKYSFSPIDLYQGVKKIAEDQKVEFNDSQRDFKKRITSLVNANVLEYWTSGSTTYIITHERGNVIRQNQEGNLEKELQ